MQGRGHSSDVAAAHFRGAHKETILSGTFGPCIHTVISRKVDAFLLLTVLCPCKSLHTGLQVIAYCVDACIKPHKACIFSFREAGFKVGFMQGFKVVLRWFKGVT